MRLVDLVETGGRYCEVQFGFPPFSIALKNSPRVGTVKVSIEIARFSSSVVRGESAVEGMPTVCCSANAGKGQNSTMALNADHFRKKSILREFSN